MSKKKTTAEDVADALPEVPVEPQAQTAAVETDVEQTGPIPELDPNNPDVRSVTYLYNTRTGHSTIQSNAMTPAEVALLLGQAMVSIAHRIREDEVDHARLIANEMASATKIVKPGDPGFTPTPGIGIPPSIIKKFGRPN